MAGYPFDTIERRWQDYWREHGTFRTPNPGEEGFDASKPKYYVLDMLPYPSGAGLHVGHPEGYTATDIVARSRRMQGYNVMHPMGWDAFGLPAEQYAVETGTHPRTTTDRNIARFREQLQRLGFSYDWSREIDTTEPGYVRWTQWIFLKLYERGLAYEAEVPVNWCEELGTALANEEVVDGKSERGGYPVVQRPMRQWMLRITAYAERLLEGLDALDWPDAIKEMQRNWIGKSVGAEIDFPIIGAGAANLTAFTTRPDTLFGATYMVLAPEHPLVDQITTPEYKSEVDAYRERARRKTERDRLEGDAKTGVFTGGHALNPVNGERLPIWIADYVLAGYGTGAIMAVPGEDQRDWEFAKAFDLQVVRTVQPPDGFEGEAYTEDGPAINSDFLDGLRVEDAKARMIEWLEEHDAGRATVTYKLRDWLFSRQRYWGEPFPIIHVVNSDGTREAKPLPPDELPVLLPDLDSFQPTGSPEGPLATVEDWVNTTDPETGRPARRETNTMPQWAGSCWYYLRYLDPRNDEAPIDPDVEQYWMPVDLYVGGAEHAVLHLLYARFWHMVLYDAGVVSTPEPFQRLVNQGMILGEVEYTTFKKADGGLVSAELVDRSTGDSGQPVRVDKRDKSVLESVTVDEDEVVKRGSGFFLADHPEVQVNARAHKMSKSRGNVVNPDDIVAEYGADSLRLYEMFMGPLEQTKPWNTRSVEGVYRFLSRAYRLLVDEESGELAATVSSEAPSDEQLRALHASIQKVTEDIDGLRFNTAIAAMMEFVNAAMKWESVPRTVAESFVKLLSPFAPHLGEELWRVLGHERSLAYESWPEAEARYLEADAVEIVVQVNGKLRGTVSVPTEAPREDVLAEARKEPNVARYLQEVSVRKEIVVPGRLVNFVVS